MGASVLEVLTDSLAKLQALGTPRQVRDFLIAEGIQGGSGAYQCPVARYLSRELGAAPNWYIACVGPEMCSVPRDGARVPTPPEIGKFIHRYDHGAYPELRSR